MYGEDRVSRAERRASRGRCSDGRARPPRGASWAAFAADVPPESPPHRRRLVGSPTAGRTPADLSGSVCLWASASQRSRLVCAECVASPGRRLSWSGRAPARRSSNEWIVHLVASRATDALRTSVRGGQLTAPRFAVPACDDTGTHVRGDAPARASGRRRTDPAPRLEPSVGQPPCERPATERPRPVAVEAPTRAAVESPVQDEFGFEQ